MEYAAVIIPTLNRKKHLKRCVDSLLRNKESKITDLYISVDYPPYPKYKKGYEEVVEYVKTISGFKTVNIYVQEKNLGPGLNRRFLENEISKKHDKYIFTDDDNEFSLNFLSYINWGLEKFKNDDSVYAICSCTDFEMQNQNLNSDYFLITSYNPYGSGHWLHKNRICSSFLNQRFLEDVYNNTIKQDRLFNISPMIYYHVALDTLRLVSSMRGTNDSITYIDIWENVYIIENNLNCIKPTLPKSRNWGLDGSGVHSKENENANYTPNVKLDNLNDWPTNPIRMGRTEELINIENHRKHFKITKKDLIKSRIIFMFNRILGNERHRKLYCFVKPLFQILKGKHGIKKDEEIRYG